MSHERKEYDKANECFTFYTYKLFINTFTNNII